MERYYFFDSNESINDERWYTGSDWSKVLSKFLENGIYKEGSNLAVTADGTNMKVNIGTGVAFINGHMYENDASLTLNVDAAEATLDRKDLVVLRLDLTEQNRYIKAFVKKGTAAASPVAPTVENSTFIKEIALAEILVTKAKSTIEQSQITDKRSTDFVDPFSDGSRIDDLERKIISHFSRYGTPQTMPANAYFRMYFVNVLVDEGDILQPGDILKFPVSGYYRIKVQALLYLGPSVQFDIRWWSTDGTNHQDIILTTISPPSTGYHFVSGETVRWFDAGRTYELLGRNNSSTNYDLINSSVIVERV